MTEETAALQKFKKELNAGTVSLVLLAVLAEAEEPMYGYRIAKELGQRSGGRPALKQGTLYPVLRSLEKSGLLASEVEPSVSGPPTARQDICRVPRGPLRWRTAIRPVLDGQDGRPPLQLRRYAPVPLSATSYPQQPALATAEVRPEEEKPTPSAHRTRAPLTTGLPTSCTRS